MADDDQTAKDSHQASGDAGLVIPPELKDKYPKLIELIIGSESMNNEERQYWINILPIMTSEQVENLRQILIDEREQLAAIDKKYAREIEQIGQEQLIKRTERERKNRREERERIEQKARGHDTEAVDDLLNQIQST